MRLGTSKKWSKHLGSQIPNPGFGILDPGSWTQDPEFRIQLRNLGSRILGQRPCRFSQPGAARADRATSPSRPGADPLATWARSPSHLPEPPRQPAGLARRAGPASPEPQPAGQLGASSPIWVSQPIWPWPWILDLGSWVQALGPRDLDPGVAHHDAMWCHAVGFAVDHCTTFWTTFSSAGDCLTAF